MAHFTAIFLSRKDISIQTCANFLTEMIANFLSGRNALPLTFFHLLYRTQGGAAGERDNTLNKQPTRDRENPEGKERWGNVMLTGTT